MWFLNTMYFNLMIVLVALAALLLINRSNSTVDFPVVADQAITNSEVANEVRLIKMYKNSDVRTNVVGFHALLERSLQRRVLKYTLNPLTNLGNNWGGILQSLEVKLIDSNDSNQVETLHLVSKFIIPATELADNSSKLSKEIHFLSKIVPAIQHFEEDENVPQIERISNAFPRYFGSRLSLNSSASEGDSNAVIILENLQCANYISKDQRSRHNKNVTMATLKVLAKMHALGISMRRKQSEIFYSIINPYLSSKPFTFSVLDFKVIDEVRSVFTNYSEIVLEATAKQHKPDPDCHTPYTTICHRDVWIKNVMFKNDNSGVDGAIQVKLIDFQDYRYESFANDLIFFLLTSAPLDDLQTNFRLFFEYYHLEFTKTLENFNIPLDDYTYDKMWHEIKQTAKLHLIRILFHIKLKHVIIDGSTSKRVSELMQYTIEQPSSDIVQIQWRSIIDLFIENKFIETGRNNKM